MKKIPVFLVNLAGLVGLVWLVSLVFVSCSEQSNEWDPYYSWESRNALWFEEVADSARTAIAEAKAQYGEEWEDHCQWRMIKSLQRSSDVQGPVTDSIICKIVPAQPGTVKGTKPVNYTDYVQLHYRAWLMPSEYISEDNVTMEERMLVFSQSYYGNFDETKVAPIAMPVISTVEGFMTALQYMVKGDDWYVYIPQELAYKDQASDAIPAYSTLLYRIRIELVHKSGTGMSEWR